MRLLRAEERADAGATVPVPQLWRLAQRWYGDRLSPTWRPRTRDEAQQVLASVGLGGPFWQLP